jgi:hypothetical protein
MTRLREGVIDLNLNAPGGECSYTVNRAALAKKNLLIDKRYTRVVRLNSPEEVQQALTNAQHSKVSKDPLTKAVAQSLTKALTLAVNAIQSHQKHQAAAK